MNENIEKSLYRGEKTTIVEYGDMGKLENQSFADGKGGKYIFGNAKADGFIMPGMQQTISRNNVSKKMEISDDMIPQGICCYNGYIFITAYSASKAYSAVIYVLDVNSKEYITTLIMQKHLHAGGVEYADGYLWIGDTGAEDTGYLFYYNYSQIEGAIKYAVSDKSITAVDMTYFDHGYINLGKGNKASFITLYKGYLCVGEYMKNIDGVGRLNLYNPKNLLNGIVKKQTLSTIPGNANGALFYSTGNKTFLLITANRGKKVNSQVHVYEVDYTTATVEIVKTKTMEMPCMIEEAFSYGEETYFVFESCAKAYRIARVGKRPAKHIVGRVCGFRSEFIWGIGSI